MDWRTLVLVVIIGVCLGLFSGLMENPPGEVGLPEYKHYGFPLVWRITQTDAPDKFSFSELFVDCLFWIAIVSAIVSAIVLIARKLAKE